jgi:hypothetical protein
MWYDHKIETFITLYPWLLLIPLLAPLMCRHDIKFVKQSSLLLCVHTSLGSIVISRVPVLHRCVKRSCTYEHSSKVTLLEHVNATMTLIQQQ